MPKFRKKPVIIEAFQFNPNAQLYYEWGDQYPNVRHTSYQEVNKLIGTSGCSKEEPYWNWDRMGIVTTIHGQDTIVVPGDYILPEPDGIHFYPCKPDIFESTYDLVSE